MFYINFIDLGKYLKDYVEIFHFSLLIIFYFIGPEIENEESYEKLLNHNTFYFTSGILKVVCKRVCSWAHTHSHTFF